MKNILFSLILIVVSICSVAQKNGASESINAFSFKLFEQVYDKEQNSFFSPYSVFGALSMTYEGAENQTKLEMGKALEIENDKNMPEDFMNLTKSFESNKNYNLLTANSIWLHKTFKLKKNYAKTTAEYYDAVCKNVDFENDNSREKARTEINDWVEKQTNKMIKDFIKQGVLDKTTAMVLVNAVYFKALWSLDFSEDETVEDKFIAASGETQNCKMMNNHLSTKYFEDETIQAIEIPYENKSASMMVILPKENSNFKLNTLDSKFYNEIINSFQVKSIKLSFPKFRLDVSYELSKPMKQLGMKTAFEKSADFSGISGSKDLIVSNIIHQSVIEVSEKGTEASSTTAVISMRSTKIAKDLPIVFKADRPFVFIIKDNTSNTILFMGYMANPPELVENNNVQKVQSRD